MKRIKKPVLLLAAVLLAAVLSACSMPTPGFMDYDVSGYIRALLDCSYHGETEELISLSGMTREQAADYNSTTVENAAVSLCNVYGLSPSEEELQELKIIMKQAFSLTKYTVKDERKVSTGYYLEVEIAPIINFYGRNSDFRRLQTEASQPESEKTYMDRVLDFCKQELANISYDGETRSLPLDILLTDEGELQLDLYQIEAIDRAVIRFE